MLRYNFEALYTPSLVKLKKFRKIRFKIKHERKKTIKTLYFLVQINSKENIEIVGVVSHKHDIAGIKIDKMVGRTAETIITFKEIGIVALTALIFVEQGIKKVTTSN
jgi:hypothetical protein